MQLIDELGDKAMSAKLRGLVTDIIVNPRWRLWSLTNKELQDIIAFHSTLGEFSNYLGANPGAYGVGMSAWGVIQKVRAGATAVAMRANIVGLVVSLVLMGIGVASAEHLKNVTEELDRRKQFR